MPYIAKDAEAEDAALLQREDDVQQAVSQLGTKRRLVAMAVAVAAGTAAVLACADYATKRSSLAKAGMEIEVLQQQFGPTAQCPSMEVNVEYKDETSGFGMNFDHIPSPDLCCALCQANEQCVSFTWVQNAGLDGCPSQCWIKGGLGVKVQGKVGLTSGVPPQRGQLAAVPSGKGEPYNSLWCFSLMTPGSTEKDLLEWQYNHQASIFACDGYAVYSNAELEVVPGVTTKVVESDLKCGYGGDSQSALNSWIFVAVWDKVCDDAEYKAYKWVVKVDPDCVFFPDRLLQLLPAYGEAQIINNCKYGLHGPIEVFSSAAIDMLGQEYAASFDGKAPKRCIEQLHFGQWGEDMFIDQCLKVLGLTNKPLVPRMICEDHCECPDFYWCQKGSDRVSYHPFKSVGAYEACMANAMADTQPAQIANHLQSMAPTR